MLKRQWWVYKRFIEKTNIGHLKGKRLVGKGYSNSRLYTKIFTWPLVQNICYMIMILRIKENPRKENRDFRTWLAQQNTYLTLRNSECDHKPRKKMQTSDLVFGKKSQIWPRSDTKSTLFRTFEFQERSTPDKSSRRARYPCPSCLHQSQNACISAQTNTSYQTHMAIRVTFSRLITVFNTTYAANGLKARLL